MPANSEKSLLKAVDKQLVSVAIDAGGLAFKFCSGAGVFAGTCSTDLNHGVTAVGYRNDENETEY